MGEYEERFGGIGRLYGTEGLERLRKAHVCIFGIGGVGSWVAEALARSGLGTLTLMDMDDLCITNTNRQIHAVAANLGHNKAEAMAARLQAINPAIKVYGIPSFFTPDTAEFLLTTHYDYVVDAIDSLANKCLLIAECRKRGYRVITSGGAGGLQRVGPIRWSDLARATNDRLLKDVRKKLRREHDFPKDPAAEFGVRAVYSTESQVFPNSDGTVCEAREDSSALKLDCASGFGTASFVAGALGFAAAEQVVVELARGE
jgi:tRNA threonylcarbamoyladenosine dehydratase